LYGIYLEGKIVKGDWDIVGQQHNGMNRDEGVGDVDSATRWLSSSNKRLLFMGNDGSLKSMVSSSRTAFLYFILLISEEL
jgi:hypothetical protein